MYCTNYHGTNHNVETYRVKRKEDPIPIVFEVTTQQIKVEKPMKYSCHICGDIGHKIIDCPKYNDMKNMLKNKGMKLIEKQFIDCNFFHDEIVHFVNNGFLGKCVINCKIMIK
jgi:hypothetical protein